MKSSAGESDSRRGICQVFKRLKWARTLVKPSRRLAPLQTASAKSTMPSPNIARATASGLGSLSRSPTIQKIFIRSHEFMAATTAMWLNDRVVKRNTHRLTASVGNTMAFAGSA